MKINHLQEHNHASSPVEDRQVERENDESDSDLETFLKAQERQKTNKVNPKAGASVTLIDVFDCYETMPRNHANQRVLVYWESQKYLQPVLYKLSQVVFVVPSTQVSVERAFSGLKFILSPFRTSMSSTLLEDTLFIRCNSQFNK